MCGGSIGSAGMNRTGNAAELPDKDGAEWYRRFQHAGWQRAASGYVGSFERVTGSYAGWSSTL